MTLSLSHSLRHVLISASFERLLRDLWETFGRLLGDFWETFERQRQRQRQKSDLDSLRNSCDAYIYLFHCFGFVFVYMFSCLDLIKKIMGDCIITLRGKVFAFDLFYFIPSFCSIFRSSPGWVFPCNLILLSS